MRNIQEGDIVFMYYPSSIKDDYRLAKVLETFPDQKGLVRSVRVGYRRRDKRDSGQEYKSKPLTEEIVAVQRLSVLLPKSEQNYLSSPDSCGESARSSTSGPTATFRTCSCSSRCPSS